MQKLLTTVLILLIINFLVGCDSNKKSPPVDTTNQNTTLDSNNQEEIYSFFVSEEWDEIEYEEIFGQNLSYFSAPIQSPYKYTYISKSEDITMNEVANELGTIMMEDFTRDYEGKSFIVTEYKNLVSHILNENEVVEWKERFLKTVKNVELEEYQWLCTFDCEYKYTGVYADIGEMPQDMEWKKTLTMDGSGENYLFIIEKIDVGEYIMRAMPKTILDISKQ